MCVKNMSKKKYIGVYNLSTTRETLKYLKQER